jgi:Zn-dependent alcohol dehydrogenase
MRAAVLTEVDPPSQILDLNLEPPKAAEVRVRAVLVGIPVFTTRVPISPSQIVYGEKVISGTYYGSVRLDVDSPILADLDLEKKINLDDLISRTYRFDEINKGSR